MPTYIIKQADFDGLTKATVDGQGAGGGLSGLTDYVVVDAVHTFTTDLLSSELSITIAGAPRVGETLTATFSDGSVDGVWHHNGVPQAATGPTYILPESADGVSVTCRKGAAVSNGITVIYDAPQATNDSVPISLDLGAPVNQSIATEFSVNGDTDLSSLTIALTGGQLPSGLVFDGAMLAGTPTQGVNTTLTFTAENSGGEATVAIPLVVNDGSQLPEIIDFASGSHGLFIDDDVLNPARPKNLFKGLQGDTDGFFVHCKVFIPKGVVPSGYIFSTGKTSVSNDYFGVSTKQTVSRSGGSTSTIDYVGGPVAGKETICTFWVHYPNADNSDRLTYYIDGVQGVGAIGQASNRTDHNRLAFGFLAGNNSAHINFYLYDLVFGQGDPAGLDAWVNAGNRADLYDFASDANILAHKSERLQRDTGSAFDLSQMSLSDWGQRNSPEWVNRTAAVPTAYVDAQPPTLSPKYAVNTMTFRIEQGVPGVLAWGDVTLNSFTIGGVDATGDFDASGNLNTIKSGDVVGSVTIAGVTSVLDGYIGPEIPLITNSPYAARAGGNGIMAAIPSYVPPAGAAQTHTSGAEVKALVDAWAASGPTEDLVLDDGDYPDYILNIPNGDYGGFKILGKNKSGLVLQEIDFKSADNIGASGIYARDIWSGGADNLDLHHMEGNFFYLKSNIGGSVKMDCFVQPEGDARNRQCKFVGYDRVTFTRSMLIDNADSDNMQLNALDSGTVYYYDRILVRGNGENGVSAHPDCIQNVGGLVKGFFGNIGLFDDTSVSGGKGVQGLFIADCDTRDLCVYRALISQSLNNKSLTLNRAQYNNVIRECSFAGVMDISNGNQVGAYQIDNVLAYEALGVPLTEDSFSIQTSITDVSALASDAVWSDFDTEYGWLQFVPKASYVNDGAGVLVAGLQAIAT